MSNYYIVSPKDRDKTMIRSLIVGSSHNMEMTKRQNSPAKNQSYYPSHLLQKPSFNHNNIQNHSNYAFKVSPSPIDISQLDEKAKISRPNDIKIREQRSFSEIQEKIQKILLRLCNQQSKVNALQQNISNKINHLGNTKTDQIIQQTINTLKKPSIMKQILTASNLNHSMNAQIYEHLFNFKMDIQNLRQQINRSLKKTQLDTQIQKINQKVHHYMEKNAQQRKKQLIDLETYFNKYFDTSFRKIQQHLKKQIITDTKQVQNQLKSKIQKMQKMQKNQPKKFQDIMNPELQISRIKCSLPPIMIKYRELLKNQAQEQMNLSEDFYFIDAQGFLLDRNSYYIVNKEGEKIQLQQNHLQILKKYNVIR